MDSPLALLPVAELDGHDSRAWHVAWNPQRPLLASCSADKTVRLYHYFRRHKAAEEGAGARVSAFVFEHVSTIPTGHAKTVRAMAWSPSGRSLATASFDSNIAIWEQERPHASADLGEAAEAAEDDQSGDWECMSLLEGHETECKSVAYSSAGNLLASCSRDKTVWIWEGMPLFYYYYYYYKRVYRALTDVHSPLQFTPTPTSSAWACSWSIPKM